MSQLDRKAAARFFMGVAQARTDRCEYTLPLFPLVLLLDTEGWLADDAQHLVGAQPQKGR